MNELIRGPEDLGKVFRQLEQWQNFVRNAEILMFYTLEHGQSSQRKALVTLAKLVKEWLKEGRLNQETAHALDEHCDAIIMAGPQTDGPPMPEPLYLSAWFSP